MNRVFSRFETAIRKYKKLRSIPQLFYIYAFSTGNWTSAVRSPFVAEP